MRIKSVYLIGYLDGSIYNYFFDLVGKRFVWWFYWGIIDKW